MAYTPPSDLEPIRLTSPEADLDDHRNQAESLPLAHEQYHGQRRGTLASIADTARPVAENVPELVLPRLESHGSTARDFEKALSIKSSRSKASIRSRGSRDEEWHRERRGSQGPITSPVVARRATFRRAMHNRLRDAGFGSRESSRSRSSSPPNSVDAFAYPRTRPRAGTANSQAMRSVDSMPISGGRNTRRGTFGEEGTAGGRTDLASRRSSVQEDVCFPTDEPSNTYTIDFEDLEEFVAQAHDKTPVAHPFTRQFSRVPQEVPPRVLQTVRTSQSGNGLTSDFIVSDVDLALKTGTNEKGAELDSDATLHRDPSQPTQIQNRFTFFSSEADETVHAPELGGLLMPDENFRDLFELGPEGGVWWLDMLNLSEEEIFAICRAFRVHPLTREDITTQETREKVELFKSYYFVCFRSFFALDKDCEDYLEPINIYAVVFREGLLTFSFCENPHAAHVLKRIGRLRDYVNLSADWICYALIDEIVDAFAPVLLDVESRTDAIEDAMFTARFEDSRSILRQIGICRKEIMSLLRLLGGKADVIKGFAKKCNEAYSIAPRGDVGLYLSDVQDHVVTMMSNLAHFEKMLSRSHANHLSQISLQHIEQGGQANALLSKVTVLATVLVPLNLIAGLFGMNVHVPGEGGDSLAWWFGILGVMITVVIVFLTIAKKMKFI